MEKSKSTFQAVDPLINRENFSISLRKKKKAEILDKKRRQNPSYYSYVDDIERLQHQIRGLLPPELKSSQWQEQFSYLTKSIASQLSTSSSPEVLLLQSGYLFKLTLSNLDKQDESFAFDLIRTNFINFVCEILTFCCESESAEDIKMAGIAVIFWLSTYSNTIILSLCQTGNPALELISLYLSTAQSDGIKTQCIFAVGNIICEQETWIKEQALLRTNVSDFLANFHSEPLETLSPTIVWMTQIIFQNGIHEWNQGIVDLCLQCLSSQFKLFQWNAHSEPFLKLVTILRDIISSQKDYVSYILMLFDADRLLWPMLKSENEDTQLSGGSLMGVLFSTEETIQIDNLRHHLPGICSYVTKTFLVPFVECLSGVSSSTHKQHEIVKKYLFALSNILSSKGFADEFLDSKCLQTLIELIFGCMEKENSLNDIHTEALYCLCFATSCCSASNRQDFMGSATVQKQILACLIRGLEKQSFTLAKHLFTTLGVFLGDFPLLCDDFIQLEGKEMTTQWQSVKNEELQAIVNKFFNNHIASSDDNQILFGGFQHQKYYDDTKQEGLYGDEADNFYI